MARREQKEMSRSPGRRASKTRLTYYRSQTAKDPQDSPFEKNTSSKKPLPKLIYRLINLVIIVAIILGLAHSLIVKPDPKVSVSDLSYRPASVYKNAIVSQFKELKNRNKVTLDEGGIVKTLQNRFPEVVDGSVQLPLFDQTATVQINVAQPDLVLLSNGTSYIVDSQGVAVAKSSDYPNIKNLPTITDQTGFLANSGKQAISVNDINFINELVAQSKHANVPIASMVLPPAEQEELDLRTSDQPYYVRFYLGGNALNQIGQFLAARHQFSSGGGPSQYLDVRVEGRIFYK